MTETESTPPPAPEGVPEETTPVVGAVVPNAGMSEHTMGMLTHLSSLSALIGVPFGNILGPLLVWVIKKDEMPFVDRHGKEALNFGISMTIYGIVAGLLCLVLIGFPILAVLFVMMIVFPIIAAMRANEGKEYEYPMTIRFVK